MRNSHSVKSVRIRSYFVPHFPAFGLNTKRYSVSLRIQSECGKMRTRITPNTDTFYFFFYVSKNTLSKIVALMIIKYVRINFKIGSLKNWKASVDVSSKKVSLNLSPLEYTANFQFYLKVTGEDHLKLNKISQRSIVLRQVGKNPQIGLPYRHLLVQS